jgi:hypothetical protein
VLWAVLAARPGWATWAFPGQSLDARSHEITRLLPRARPRWLAGYRSEIDPFPANVQEGVRPVSGNVYEANSALCAYKRTKGAGGFGT